MSTHNSTVDVAYVAGFAALICVFAFVAIPIGAAGVPIVLQNAVIILTALIVGARRAVLATALFLTVGLALPVLAGGRTTLVALAGPTAGYLLGYLLAAAVAGALAYRALPRARGSQLTWFTAAGVAGLAAQYLCGALGLVLRTDLSLAAAAAAQLPFLAVDAAKVAAMVLIALGVHAAIPDLLPRRP
ncbi:biotin transporter BioY [Corynebacterium uterequi]|uniref:Biotin transporter n=1 Tax=Corynebacterium uterequi TaxID=1072256 RepID=A0A0G3HJK7_9CORY|nr:biotin transporter BioY [Corynebacterium uterequi]AKK11302.1 hypothetical protein CUTER_06565 [Corynebacterium uterequi]